MPFRLLAAEAAADVDSPLPSRVATLFLTTRPVRQPITGGEDDAMVLCTTEEGQAGPTTEPEPEPVPIHSERNDHGFPAVSADQYPDGPH